MTEEVFSRECNGNAERKDFAPCQATSRLDPPFRAAVPVCGQVAKRF
jgi:hypothetical protein